MSGPIILPKTDGALLTRKKFLNMTATEIAITLPNRKRACGKIIYLQPNTEPWLQPSLDLDIHCAELLQPSVYEAVLTDGVESMSGHYHIHDYEEAEDERGWLFFGTFDRMLTG